MKPTIRLVIEGVNMGLGHIGLAALLKKQAKLDVEELTGTDLIMCINGHGDKMKVIGARGLVIGYLRMPNKMRIMKDALQYIPQTFGSGGFNYDKACEEALSNRLRPGRAHPKSGPINAARAMKNAGL